jgi:type VI secretion system protein ImpM
LNLTNTVGFFGKLPAHGDFIYRGLPSQFIQVWDEWLQGFVGCSQEQLGESWLDIYLTSPIWRFAFSDGVIDQHQWAGIVLPSVDRVGRYFPFSIASKVPATENPLDVIHQTAWFDAIETFALSALEGQLTIDDLLEELNQFEADSPALYHLNNESHHETASVITIGSEDQAPQLIFSALLNVTLKEKLSSYSVWSTKGSNFVEPCLFYSRGLPPLKNVAAMLDGQWGPRGWREPCLLNR